MARIVLDQYRKLIDCRLVQIMDRDRDTDFLDQYFPKSLLPKYPLKRDP